MKKKKLRVKDPPDRAVLLDEEYGYASYLWVPPENYEIDITVLAKTTSCLSLPGKKMLSVGLSFREGEKTKDKKYHNSKYICDFDAGVKRVLYCLNENGKPIAYNVTDLPVYGVDIDLD